MKISFPDSLFVRLFLLLFVILSVSYFAGREILVSLGFEHCPLPAASSVQAVCLPDQAGGGRSDLLDRRALAGLPDQASWQMQQKNWARI